MVNLPWKKSISKFLQIFEQNSLLYIWRICNPSLKWYNDILLKNHFSGFIQHRLDDIFILNSIQEYFKKVSILPSFCSGHSPISCILESSSQVQLGKNFRKFNSSLINNEKHVTQMKQHISKIKSHLNPVFRNKTHVQWEFLKYKILKFSIEFSKTKAKLRCEKLSLLKVKLKELEQSIDEAKELYNAMKLMKCMTK